MPDNSLLSAIAEKVRSGERLSREDGLALFRTDDIFTLGELSSLANERKNGKRAFFILNRHINPTNICTNRCRFCAFSRSKGDHGAYELSVGEILDTLAKTTDEQGPVRELHIVGGLHPDRPFDYYRELLTALRQHYPETVIKAFTAVEIDHLATTGGLSAGETLAALRECGLDLMPGGGAEIFDPDVRAALCPEKISGQRWLEIMETAHGLGIQTNATMLYGHVETEHNRVDHLLALRELQDLTSGFQAFIPLSYQPGNTGIGGSAVSAIDDLRTIAASRLILDNFDHIKAYWVMLGEKLAQVALLFGADDLDGTVIEERIAKAAGGPGKGVLTKNELVSLIRKAGKIPVERDALYHTVREY